jgi:hypothetical protein
MRPANADFAIIDVAEIRFCQPSSLGARTSPTLTQTTSFSRR